MAFVIEVKKTVLKDYLNVKLGNRRILFQPVVRPDAVAVVWFECEAHSSAAGLKTL